MKLKYEFIIKILTLAIILLLVACFVSSVMLIIYGPRDGIFTPRKKVNETNNTSHVILTETHDFGQYYINNLVFLGDSTIAKMKDAGVLYEGSETTQIWSDESGDLVLDFSIDKTAILFPKTQKAISITEAAAEKKPEYMVITVGINNGVAYCSEDSFKEYYGKLIAVIKEASPDTKIILQSILPVSKKYEKETSGITQKKIDTANDWILALAETHNVKFLDTASALKDSKGYLKSEYDSGNGLHLNETGYNVLLNYIRTHGYK